MTTHTDVPRPRRRVARTAAVAGATLLLSLSTGPVAHADGGLLGDLTQAGDQVTQVGAQVGGGATDPVVTPAVEAVQSAVPQPAQQPAQQAVQQVVEQVVEPAAEHVVEPVVSQVGQVGKEGSDADRVAQPVREVVEPVVRSSGEPAGEPSDRPGTGTGQASGAAAPAQAGVAAPGSHGPGGPSAHGGGDGATAHDGPRGGQRPPGGASCTTVGDLPPRGAATSAVLHGQATHDGRDAVDEAGDPMAALMRRWSGGTWGSADVGAPERRLADVPWFDAPGDAVTGGASFGGSGTVPLLLGLLGVMGLLLAGVSLARSRQPEGVRRPTS